MAAAWVLGIEAPVETSTPLHPVFGQFMKSLIELCCESRRINRALEKIQKKSQDQPYRKFEIDGISFHLILRNKRHLIREIRQTIRGTGIFSPAKHIWLSVNQKRRRIAKFHLIDFIIHTIVSDVLSEISESQLSSSLHSYRKGRSNLRAVSAFAKFVRTHRNERELKHRGLWVIRRDVSSYGDSIPVGENSHLWSELTEMFESNGRPLLPGDLIFLKRLIRHEITTDTGGFTPLVGIPTGSPLSSALLNIYLSRTDHFLSAQSGDFYGRYGDDILYATPEKTNFLQCRELLEEEATRLGLRFGVSKSQEIFFSGSGASTPECKGDQYITFLGLRITFKGNICLPPSKEKIFLAQVKSRLDQSWRLLPSESDLSARLRFICGILREMMNHRGVSPVKYSDLLLTVVDDRSQLRQLDLRIHRRLSELLTKKSAPFSLRERPPKETWAEGNYKSLLATRNGP